MRFLKWGRLPDVFQHPQLPQQSSVSLHEQLDLEREKTRAATDALREAQHQLAECKRRAEKRHADARIAGIVAACSQLIPGLDDMARAFKQVPDELRAHPWLQGMYLANSEFARTLRALGMVRITISEEAREMFDPFKQHAIGMELRADLPEGMIVRTVQPGYLFRVYDGERLVQERLIRPAQVIVSTQMPVKDEGLSPFQED